MRKLFIGTILVSLLGALAIGAVLAWTGSTTGSSSAQAGSVSVAFYGYDQLSNKVVPNNQWIEVANGGLTNNGDIAVHVRADPNAGSVSTISYANSCGGAPYTDGAVNQESGSSVNPGNSADDLYRVYLRAATGLPDACQGQTISYDVTINVES